MSAMNGFEIFEKITNLSDKFIDEAAEMPSPELAVVKTSPWKRFSRFMNSGLGVAMVCTVVAIGVIVGIVAAGRVGGPVVPPASSDAQPTEAETVNTHPSYDFSYEPVESKERYLYYESVGITVTVVSKGPDVTLTMENLFSFTPMLVPHGQAPDSENAIRGQFNYDEARHPENNETHIKVYDAFFKVPDGAWEGYYDLYCYFGEEYQCFPSAVKLVSNTHPTLDFSYTAQRVPEIYARGEVIDLTTIMINTEEAFVFEGDHANEFGATARLVLHGADTDTALTETLVSTDTFYKAEVTTGMRLERQARITIPEDAVEGYYDLYLCFGEEYRIFEKAITIGIPPRFLFTYEFRDSFYGYTEDPNYMEGIPGDKFELYTTIVNNGDTFTYIGGREDFRAYIEFSHSEDSTVTFTGEAGVLETYDSPQIVESGREEWCGYTVTVPADAPAGRYHLRLYYDDVSCMVENALTVKRNDIPAEGTLTSIVWNGQTVTLTYQRTVDEYGLQLLDQYLGSDGLLYSFYSDTSHLYAFDHPEIREGSPDKTDTVTLAEGRSIADGIMSTLTAISDLSAFQIEEGTAAGHCYSYWYHHMAGSIETDYWVHILMNKHGDIVSFSASGWAKNLPHITEADIRAAQKRLTGSDEGRPALTIKDGVLCVYIEDIFFKPAETDEDGNIIGEDGHEHKFYYEEITPSS